MVPDCNGRVIASIEAFEGLHVPKILQTAISEARQGMLKGLPPRLAEEGIGGTYFLRSTKGDMVAVFKPGEEEPFMPNNPKGHVGIPGQMGVRPGVRAGEGHIREVAAFLLDHGAFSDVPATSLATVQHDAFFSVGTGAKQTDSKQRVGSVQTFVHFNESAGDMAPQSFPVQQVHKVAILDIRLLNLDRNDGNLLVRIRQVVDQRPADAPYWSNRPAPGRWIWPDSRLQLIPIDHSYCLPDRLEVPSPKPPPPAPATHAST